MISLLIAWDAVRRNTALAVPATCVSFGISVWSAYMSRLVWLSIMTLLLPATFLLFVVWHSARLRWGRTTE